MSAEGFRCHNGRLSSVLRVVKEPTSSVLLVDGSKELAALAFEALEGARLPEAYELMIQSREGPVPLPASVTGSCLHQLGHACFHGGLEDGLRRYLKWLEVLAAGHPFPEHQLRSRP